VTDNRTGKTIEVPIKDNAIPATAFKKLAAPYEEKVFALSSQD